MPKSHATELHQRGDDHDVREEAKQSSRDTGYEATENRPRWFDIPVPIRVRPKCVRPRLDPVVMFEAKADNEPGYHRPQDGEKEQKRRNLSAQGFLVGPKDQAGQRPKRHEPNYEHQQPFLPKSRHGFILS